MPWTPPRPRTLPAGRNLPSLMLLLSLLVVALAACTTASTPTAPALTAAGGGGAAAPPVAPPPPGRPSKAAAPLDLSAVSGDRALAHVRELSVTIGSRPTGGEKERAAADYIEQQFRSYGYQVTRQQFEFPWFEDLSTLALAGGEKIETGQIARSKEAAVTAELADAGDANQLGENSLTGKIALAERGGRSFEQKAAEAAKAGAAGLIIFNNQPGHFAGGMQGGASIPVLAISREDGLKLRDQLKSGPVTVEMAVQGRRSSIQSQNVVARGGEQCAVVVGGHYDSVAQAPGANDNASGTAVTLEAARAAQPAAADLGLCFVAFGGEELGLHGSRAFVRQLSGDERNFMLGMVNLDMVGFGDRWRATGDPKLVDLSLNAAQQAGIEAERFSLPQGVGSDHESFLQANIPAVYPALIDDPLFHTPQDAIERLAPANLQQAGRWALAIVAELTR